MLWVKTAELEEVRNMLLILRQKSAASGVAVLACLYDEETMSTREVKALETQTTMFQMMKLHENAYMTCARVSLGFEQGIQS